MKLKAKMILSICGIAFISFALTITIISLKAVKTSNEQASQLLSEMGNRYGRAVKNEMDIAADAARNLAATVDGPDSEAVGKPGSTESGRYCGYWYRSDGKNILSATTEPKPGEPWYYEAFHKKSPFVTEPTVYASLGNTILVSLKFNPGV